MWFHEVQRVLAKCGLLVPVVLNKIFEKHLLFGSISLPASPVPIHIAYIIYHQEDLHKVYNIVILWLLFTSNWSVNQGNTRFSAFKTNVTPLWCYILPTWLPYSTSARFPPASCTHIPPAPCSVTTHLLLGLLYQHKHCGLFTYNQPSMI